MDITYRIKGLLQEALFKIGVEDIQEEDIIVEIPNNTENGDYSSNIAMLLASKLKRSPLEIAEDIIKNIVADEDIKSIEIVKPGFINFFLSNRFLLAEIIKIVDQPDTYFKLNEKEGETILIEYTDANPFKELHIGHLYSNAVGESIARLQEALGATVKRACYQGDIGLHVAKTLWGLERQLEEDETTFQVLEKLSLEDRVCYLGKAYSLGEEFYTKLKDSVTIKEIDDINYYLYSLTLKSVKEENSLGYDKKLLLEKYTKGKQWCLDFFETIYEKVGTTFDYYFFESEVADLGLKVVCDNIGKVFEKEETGSVVYRGEKEKNLHTRVFINKYGLPTYETKEIGLAFKKSEIVDYDKSIMVTADEQSGYFKVVLDALSKIDNEIVKKIEHISHGKVKLPGSKKMSSREGKIVSAQWLIDEAMNRVKDIMEDNNEFDGEILEVTSEKIAIAAIKYAFLKITIGKDIPFDFDKSIQFDGDTGSYLMYTYSRCNSILEEGTSVSTKALCLGLCLDNPFVRDLIAHIGKYKGALLDSATNYSPSILSQYLFNLAKLFNSFYQNVRVLDAIDEDRQILLLLVNATMLVMEDGLDNLGITTVDRM